MCLLQVMGAMIYFAFFHRETSRRAIRRFFFLYSRKSSGWAVPVHTMKDIRAFIYILYEDKVRLVFQSLWLYPYVAISLSVLTNSLYKFISINCQLPEMFTRKTKREELHLSRCFKRRGANITRAIRAGKPSTSVILFRTSLIIVDSRVSKEYACQMSHCNAIFVLRVLSRGHVLTLKS